MAEKTVVIADFASPGEAHLALNLLEAEGIPGHITGDEPTATTFSMLGRMPFAAPIQLHVAASQADRALQILDQSAQDRPPRGWKDEAEATEGWICPLCDTLVEDQDATRCPACQEPRRK